MPRRQWTDEEINTLVSMWPKASIIQIANTLHRTYLATREMGRLLRERGLLEAKNNSTKFINQTRPARLRQSEERLLPQAPHQHRSNSG